MNFADRPSEQPISNAPASHASSSIDPLRAYLIQLAVALEGGDAALCHDALIDAEEHLRAAIAAGTPVSQALAEYGTPDEIAAAYLGSRVSRVAATMASSESAPAPAPVPSPSPLPQPTSPLPETAVSKRRLRDIPIVGIWFHPVAWRALAYFGIVSFPLATIYFVWAVTVGSLAIGTVPTIVGLPLIVFLLGSARALSLFEGKVVEFFLGVRMPRRTQPIAGVGDGAAKVGFWHRIWCWLRDLRSWLSLGYLVGNFPVSLACFIVTLILTVVSLAFILLPLFDVFGQPIGHVVGSDSVSLKFLFFEATPDANGDVWLPAGAAIPSFLVGVLLFTATLWLVRGMGWVYAHVVQVIQVARPQPSSMSRDSGSTRAFA